MGQRQPCIWRVGTQVSPYHSGPNGSLQACSYKVGEGLCVGEVVVVGRAGRTPVRKGAGAGRGEAAAVLRTEVKNADSHEGEVGAGGTEEGSARAPTDAGSEGAGAKAGEACMARGHHGAVS